MNFFKLPGMSHNFMRFFANARCLFLCFIITIEIFIGQSQYFLLRLLHTKDHFYFFCMVQDNNYRILLDKLDNQNHFLFLVNIFLIATKLKSWKRTYFLSRIPFNFSINNCSIYPDLFSCSFRCFVTFNTSLNPHSIFHS